MPKIYDDKTGLLLRRSISPLTSTAFAKALPLIQRGVACWLTALEGKKTQVDQKEG